MFPFHKVNRVSQSEWSRVPHALSRARVGDLLHLGEVNERRGGILKIRRTGTFVLLQPEQGWHGVKVTWPNLSELWESFVIDDSGVVTFNPRDRRRPDDVRSYED